MEDAIKIRVAPNPLPSMNFAPIGWLTHIYIYTHMFMYIYIYTVGQPEGALNGPLWARNHMSDSRYLLLISFSGARLGLPFIVN